MRSACVLSLVAMLGGCPSSRIVERDAAGNDAGSVGDAGRGRGDASRGRDAGREREDAGGATDAGGALDAATTSDACSPIAESCDSIDNDCDALVDEMPDTLCTPPRATGSCEAGACALVACEAPFADCNADAADGCEVDLATDSSSCGSCGRACEATETCVAGLCTAERVVQLTSGMGHQCARRADGQVMCWGPNDRGQLGDGTRVDSATPVLVAGIDDAIDVDTGAETSCALREDGTITCWGSAPPWGTGFDARPVALAEPAIDLEVVGWGYNTVCAVGTSGAVACSAINDGNGLYWDRVPTCFCPTPALEPIHGLGSASRIALSGWWFCALVSGDAMCWGVGVGRTVPPTRIELPEPVEEIAGGDTNHECARVRSGDVYCWGSNRGGAIAVPPSDELLPPARMAIGGVATDIASGFGYTCAVLAGGGVVCWGTNSSGQLGRGPAGEPLTPGAVPDVHDVAEIGPTGLRNCARHTSGALTCWGWRDGVVHPPAPFWGLP